MKDRSIHILLIIFCCLVSLQVFGQFQAKFSGNVDLGLQYGEADSHFYINGVHKNHKNWAFRPVEINLITRLEFSEQWFVNGRLQLEQDEGNTFDQFRVSQLNLNWVPDDTPWQFTLGRFINPFGAFNQKQLSINRSFIDVPLAYGYYTNISPYIGYAPGLGEVQQLSVDNRLHWGLPNNYYNGYSNGIKAKWAVKPNKLSAEIALATAAPLEQKNLNFKPWNYAVISRVMWQPAFFWKQGVSISYGSFFRDNALNAILGQQFNQLLIGTDFKAGIGFFEISGEFTWASHQVPWYDIPTGSYLDADPEAPPYFTLNNWSAYLDLRYEFSFLPGTYLACRLDTLQFGETDNGYSAQSHWDNNVRRFTLALGVQPQSFLLVRMAYALQNISSQNADLNTFRTTLTAFF